MNLATTKLSRLIVAVIFGALSGSIVARAQSVGDLECGEDYHKARLFGVDSDHCNGVYTRYYFTRLDIKPLKESRRILHSFDAMADNCRQHIPCNLPSAHFLKEWKTGMTISGTINGSVSPSAMASLKVGLEELVEIGAQLGWSYTLAGSLTVTVDNSTTDQISGDFNHCWNQHFDWWATDKVATGSVTEVETYVWSFLANFPECPGSWEQYSTVCERAGAGSLLKRVGDTAVPNQTPCCSPLSPPPAPPAEPCCFIGPC